MVHVFFRDLKVFKYHTDELFSWENILGEFRKEEMDDIDSGKNLLALQLPLAA